MPFPALGAFLISILCSGAAAQTTWFVDDDACPGPGSGTALDPFCSIQDGIVAAVAGDCVLVLPGTYAENLNFLGKAIVVKSQDGVAATTLVGDGTAAIVTFSQGEGLDSVLQGFTLTGNVDFHAIVCLSSPTVRGNLVTGNFTGGIGSTAGAHIVGNVVRNNSGDLFTGGIEATGTSLVEANLIEQNSSGFDTGGLRCGDSAVARNNTIRGNTSGNGLVGGVWCLQNSVLEGNLIEGNTFTDALVGGVLLTDSATAIGNRILGNEGGLLVDGGSHSIVNNVIAWNFDGPGIDISSGSATLLHNTVHGNGAFGGAGGLVVRSRTQVDVANCILWGNTGITVGEIYAANAGSVVNVSWSDVEGGPGGVAGVAGGTVLLGAGVIDVDPGFADPDGLDDDPATLADNDLHLTAVSPCVDAGDTLAAGLPAMDGEGDPRRFDVPGVPDTGNGSAPLVDLGADEFHPHLYFLGDLQPGGSFSLEVAGLPGATALIWLSATRREPPLDTALGPFFLEPPLLGLPPLTLPAGGILTLVGTLPPTPGPYLVYWQAVEGFPLVLTNLAVLDVP